VMLRQATPGVLRVKDRILDQRPHVRAFDPVEHLRSGSTGPHQPAHPQLRQMLRHRSGRLADRLGQLVDCQLTVKERPQQPDPGRIGQHSEHLDRQVDLLGRRLYPGRLLIRIHTQIMTQRLMPSVRCEHRTQHEPTDFRPSSRQNGCPKANPYRHTPGPLSADRGQAQRPSRKTCSVNHPGQRGLTSTLARVTELKISYARVSTTDQDLTAQRDALAGLGVDPDRVYVDHGITGTNRDRPGLRQALAACRRGDTLVVTKLDRLARSVPDARDIADELTTAGVKLNIGGLRPRPHRPDRPAAVHHLAMIAEFEADLARARTREGMAAARAKGRLGGKQPKLTPRQEAHLVQLYRTGEHTISELEELFPVTRSTIYRAVARARFTPVATGPSPS